MPSVRLSLCQPFLASRLTEPSLALDGQLLELLATARVLRVGKTSGWLAKVCVLRCASALQRDRLQGRRGRSWASAWGPGDNGALSDRAPTGSEGRGLPRAMCTRPRKDVGVETTAFCEQRGPQLTNALLKGFPSGLGTLPRGRQLSHRRALPSTGHQKSLPKGRQANVPTRHGVPSPRLDPRFIHRDQTAWS